MYNRRFNVIVTTIELGTIDMNKDMLNGIITALITPIDQDGKLDHKSLENLINRQIAASIDGLVIAGSTGEGNMLSENEYYELIAQAGEYGNKQIPIIPTIAGASTSSALVKLEKLNKLGTNARDIDKLLCTVPHYVKPSQEGIIEHFSKLCKNTDIPIIIYNHPGRTGVSISDESLSILSTIKNIHGIKDGADDITRPTRLHHLTRENNFRFLSADDTTFLSYIAAGGDGIISVMSNLYPKLMKMLYNLALIAPINEAAAIQQDLSKLIELVMSSPNPVGIKYVLSSLDLCKPNVHSPLTELNNKLLQNNIKSELKKIMPLADELKDTLKL